MNAKQALTLGLSAALVVCSQADAGKDSSIGVCTKAAYQIAHDRRNGQQWHESGTDSVLLHLAGCDEQDGGATSRWAFSGEGVQSGHCNRRAYNMTASYIRSGHNIAADDASIIGRIWQAVTRKGKHCGSFEDGTYYGK